jgi:hypothetical protein
MTAGLTGIYSELLVLLLPTIALAAALRGIALAARKQARELRRLVSVLLVAVLLAFVLNPVGGARAARRYFYLMDASAGLGRGNVDWMVDLRCVLGLMPFGRYAGGIGAGFAHVGYALAGVAVLVAAGMILGVTRVPPGARQAVLSVLLAHAALLAYSLFSGYTYGYFKGWGYGLPTYLVLLSAGLHRLLDLSIGKAYTRVLTRLSVVGIWLLSATISVHLALRMEDHLACTPGVAELSRGVQFIPEGASMYAVTVKANRVRVFLIAYFLLEHPAHYDARVIYTSEPAREYEDEKYVLVQRDATFDFEAHSLEPRHIWSGSEFGLYQVR